MQLRDYQHRDLADIREAFREHNAVLFVAPTGYGKTALASEIMRSALSKGKSVLFVVHRREIVMDTAKRLSELNPCIVMSGIESKESILNVASVQTLYERDLFPHADLVIWDECHHVAAKTYQEIRSKYDDAIHLGLTATPIRSDDSGLDGCFDVIVDGEDTATLTENGFLAPCDAIVTEESTGNITCAIEAVRKYCTNRRAVVFCATIERAEYVAEQLDGSIVHGEMSKRARSENLQAFVECHTNVLVNVMVLTEGWDCPSADTVVLERQCGNWGVYLQIVGRARRVDPKNPSKTCLIVDCADNVRSFGMPDMPRKYSLEPTKTSKKFALRLCPVCRAVRRNQDTKCWRCGNEYPAKLLAEFKRLDFIELDPVESNGLSHTQNKRLKQWQWVAQNNGLPKGWPMQKFKKTYGFIPFFGGFK